MMKVVLFLSAAVAASAQRFTVDCGGGATCQDGQTCCPTSSGGWGCCPAPKATCCPDKVHCCPSDYPVCDSSSGRCKSSSGFAADSVPFLRKLPVLMDDSSNSRAALGLGASAKDCGSSSSAIQFSSTTIDPTSPSKGSPVTLYGNGTSSAAISAAEFLVTAELNGKKVFSKEGDACGNTNIKLPLGLGTIAYHGLSCPLAKGASTSIALGVTIPDVAPAGSYTFKVLSKESSGADVFCLEATMSL